MRRALRALALALGVSASGCAFLEDEPPPDQLVCRSDAECAAGQVCFVDGCGNPGGDIVVEVQAHPKAGLLAQDFPVDRLRPEQNLELFSPVRLRGEVSRGAVAAADGGVAPIAYRGPVHLLATGESRLIPGVGRRYETTLIPDNGAWVLPVGSGDYTVTLTPVDKAVPPLVRTASVDPATGGSVAFDLPTPARVITLSGRLVLQGSRMVDADVEVQALDDALRPLSQRARVSRDTGGFQLALGAEDAARPTLLLRVTPLTASDVVPRKTFVVDPSESFASALELGDPGAVVRVEGRVLETDAAAPMEGARVSLQGRVAGGGTFQGVPVLTDAQGRYQLTSLPGLPESPLTLVIVPPPAPLAPHAPAGGRVHGGHGASGRDVPAAHGGDGQRAAARRQRARVGRAHRGGAGGRADGLAPAPMGFEAPFTTDGAGGFQLALDPASTGWTSCPGRTCRASAASSPCRPGPRRSRCWSWRPSRCRGAAR